MGDSEVFISENIAVLCGLLIFTLFVSVIFSEKLRLTFLPSSVMAMLVGGGLGAYFLLYSISVEEREHLWFKPNVLYFVLLPPIVFEAGYSTKRKSFFRNASRITIFAFLGTLINAITIGVGLYEMSSRGWLDSVPDVESLNLNHWLMFGVLLSAIDPVATLSVLGNSDLRCDPHLYTLVFGESVCNNVVALVLFQTLLDMSQRQEDLLSFHDIPYMLLDFLYSFFGSIAVAIIVTMIIALLLRKVNFTHHPSSEFILMIASAYACYAISEFFKLSGIMAIFLSGTLHAHYSFYNVSHTSKTVTHQVFHAFAHTAETCLYIYLGINSVLSFTAVKEMTYSPILVASATFFCFFGRAISVIPLSLVVNTLGKAGRKKRNGNKEKQGSIGTGNVDNAGDPGVAIGTDHQAESTYTGAGSNGVNDAGRDSQGSFRGHSVGSGSGNAGTGQDVTKLSGSKDEKAEKHRVTPAMQFAMIFISLRGALSFAMAMAADVTVFATTTMAIVVVSTGIIGIFSGPVLSCLGLAKQYTSREHVLPTGGSATAPIPVPEIGARSGQYVNPQYDYSRNNEAHYSGNSEDGVIAESAMDIRPRSHAHVSTNSLMRTDSGMDMRVRSGNDTNTAFLDVSPTSTATTATTAITAATGTNTTRSSMVVDNTVPLVDKVVKAGGATTVTTATPLLSDVCIPTITHTFTTANSNRTSTSIRKNSMGIKPNKVQGIDVRTGMATGAAPGTSTSTGVGVSVAADREGLRACLLQHDDSFISIMGPADDDDSDDNEYDSTDSADSFDTNTHTNGNGDDDDNYGEEEQEEGERKRRVSPMVDPMSYDTDLVDNDDNDDENIDKSSLLTHNNLSSSYNPPLYTNAASAQSMHTNPNSHMLIHTPTYALYGVNDADTAGSSNDIRTHNRPDTGTGADLRKLRKLKQKKSGKCCTWSLHSWWRKIDRTVIQQWFGGRYAPPIEDHDDHEDHGTDIHNPYVAGLVTSKTYVGDINTADYGVDISPGDYRSVPNSPSFNIAGGHTNIDSGTGIHVPGTGAYAPVGRYTFTRDLSVDITNENNDSGVLTNDGVRSGILENDTYSGIYPNNIKGTSVASPFSTSTSASAYTSAATPVTITRPDTSAGLKGAAGAGAGLLTSRSYIGGYSTDALAHRHGTGVGVATGRDTGMGNGRVIGGAIRGSGSGVGVSGGASFLPITPSDFASSTSSFGHSLSFLSPAFSHTGARTSTNTRAGVTAISTTPVVNTGTRTNMTNNTVVNTTTPSYVVIDRFGFSMHYRNPYRKFPESNGNTSQNMSYQTRTSNVYSPPPVAITRKDKLGTRTNISDITATASTSTTVPAVATSTAADSRHRHKYGYGYACGPRYGYGSTDDAVNPVRASVVPGPGPVHASTDIVPATTGGDTPYLAIDTYTTAHTSDGLAPTTDDAALASAHTTTQVTNGTIAIDSYASGAGNPAITRVDLAYDAAPTSGDSAVVAATANAATYTSNDAVRTSNGAASTTDGVVEPNTTRKGKKGRGNKRK